VNYVTLLGAEAVENAGHRIASAAESIRQSAAYIEASLLQHSRSMENLVYRLEALEERDRTQQGEEDDE